MRRVRGLALFLLLTACEGASKADSEHERDAGAREAGPRDATTDAPETHATDSGRDAEDTGDTLDAQPPIMIDSGLTLVGTQSAIPWATGGALLVRSALGHLQIVPGEPDEIGVRLRGFVRHDAADATDSATESFTADLSTDSEGNVVVILESARSAPEANAEVTIAIPPTFDGDLRVEHASGDVDVTTTGASKSVSVSHLGDGNVQVYAAAAGRLDVYTTRGDMTVQINRFEAAAPGGSFIVGETGGISLALPGAGAFELEAFARAGVDFGTLPEACESTTFDETASLLTCGDGTTRLVADALFAPEGEVSVTYH